VELLFDVRRSPFSRRNPQFNRPTLSEALDECGISYRHLAELGGMREAGASPSPNCALPEGAFRNYADYAASFIFQETLKKVISESDRQRIALICAESGWRHCHRRIIADHLISYGKNVLHLGPNGEEEAAAPDPLAMITGPGQVTYPPRQGDLF
ncbi:MAG: DUF488 domain-containing protein, partial [Kiloniellales bacterium]|nr:DUF488 domain-containing protein [Kiloniellales bacterium]